LVSARTKKSIVPSWNIAFRCAAELEPLLGVEARERMMAGKKIDPGVNWRQGQGKASEQAAAMFPLVPIGTLERQSEKALLHDGIMLSDVGISKN
jgi:hypothetical protein|tara:strand:+ start:79 stop:363 length:285 start_codon:yes stop_codon:yes gene_type:complete